MSRPMVIGYMQVETAQDKAFRHAMVGASVDSILAEPKQVPKLWHDEGSTPEGRPLFWCLADGSEITQGEDFKLAPIYRTSWLPEGAQCEVCGIELAELQRMFTETVKGGQTLDG